MITSNCIRQSVTRDKVFIVVSTVNLHLNLVAPNQSLQHPHPYYVQCCTTNTTYLFTCLDHHSSMLNLTSRLAIKIKYFPDYEFDWSDTSPQRPQTSLRVEHFLPNENDAIVLKQRAVQYIMGFLVEPFASIKDLAEFVPKPKTVQSLAEFVPKPKTVHLGIKSEIVPMKILFKDEKYKS